MKGLLLKEWFVIWKQSKLMIIMALIYCGMAVAGNGFFFAGFAVVFLSMLPIAAMGFDERSKWDHYAVTMPYSRKEIVVSKYILTALGSMTAVVLFIVSAAIKMIIEKSTTGFMDLINQAVLMLSFGLLYSTISMPVMFKFGVDKGRLWLILITVLAIAGVGSLLSFFESDASQIMLFIQKLSPFVLPVITIGLLALSALISVKIYENREL